MWWLKFILVQKQCWDKYKDMTVSFVCTFICTFVFCSFEKEGTVVGQETMGVGG